MRESDTLQEELERYCTEKNQFDGHAQQVKEQGELDQIESEKIGFFKANRQRLLDELKQ